MNRLLAALPVAVVLTCSCAAFELGYPLNTLRLGVGKAVVKTSDGGYALACATQLGPGVLKVDSAGAPQWLQAFNAQSGFTAFNTIAQTSDGGYALSGTITSLGGHSVDLWVLKLDSAGAVQWQKRFDPGVNAAGDKIIQTSDGGYALAVGLLGVILKLDSTGAVVWCSKYQDTANHVFNFRDVIQASDGSLVACGNLVNNGAADSGLVATKLNVTNGNLVWQRVLSPASAPANGLFLTELAGPLYVVSGSITATANSDAWVVAFDVNGASQWQRQIGGAGLQSTGILNNLAGIVASPDGNVTFAATLNVASGSTAWLVKLDLLGNILFQNTYANPVNAFGLALSSSGGFALTGSNPVGAWLFTTDVAGVLSGGCSQTATTTAAVTTTTTADAGLAIAQQNVAVTFTPTTLTTSSSVPTPLCALPASPVITSALTAEGQVDANFSYQITATNAPASFSAAGLPDGLILTGDTISGTPTTAGVFNVRIGVANAGGGDQQTLVIGILDAPVAGAPAFGSSGTTPPVFASLPTATPNPATAGQAVTFGAAAVDPAKGAVTYFWDFGDGTSASGAAPTHTYAAAGVYTAQVLAGSAGGATAHAVLVAVNADATTGNFAVAKLQVKFDFKKADNDSLACSGTIPVVTGVPVAGSNVVVSFGDNLVYSFQLSAKGSFASQQASFKLQGKLKDGAFTAPAAKFTFTAKKGNLFDFLTDLGFAKTVLAKFERPVTVPVLIAINSDGFTGKTTVNYTATPGKSGSGKN